MRIVAAILATTIAGCAGPGTVAVGQSAEGIQFEFFYRGHPGNELPHVEVYEWNDGVRGRTVCKLRINVVPQGHRVTLARWVYGRSPPEGDYRVEACEELLPNRTYGISGFRADHRLVWADFWIANDGTVVLLASSRD
jgi:hypothetical protein